MDGYHPGYGLEHAKVLTDASWKGMTWFLSSVRKWQTSCVIKVQELTSTQER